jgi:hypothetical protein
MQLLDMATVTKSFGRGIVLRAPEWDFASDLVAALTHPAITEGNIVFTPNGELAKLTMPEFSGPAAHEIDYTGEAPVLTVPMFLTDPANAAMFSPTGTESAGRSRRSAPLTHTIVLMPEGVFLRDPDPDRIVTAGVLTYAGGAWLLDGSPIGAAREDLMAASIWIWKAVCNRPPRTFFGGAGARKQIHEVTFETMHHPDAPEGHHIYTIGDPTLSGIDPTTGILS